MSDLSQYLSGEKKKYLLEQTTSGGKAEGFREHIRRQYWRDASMFNKLVLDALMEATTKSWQQQPRKRGPDLFSIADYVVPEYLTRRASEYQMGEDEEEEYEKVDHTFATVNDFLDDATIHLRKAAQASAAAEREMSAVDEARRRARGHLDVFLRDIAD